ncbi:hypothetical protein XAP412_1190091 [Xanthomonas phaseoli pv. phaseoli]|uniref:Transposase n=1 Tax=Xanthomonas campestris pv. phaseoli TaxID=317013 RepID=A0AB38DVG1_XANCH|nr:hypothetical protein XAP6984_1230093 [Xanthomonas phaseoli pv. phaseoli]SON76976.1 hypothetical protein XAP412_1190091 [Xanthomonas phaseoli pv. phaseoli]SON81912.1 hypothetical protein XAP7430_1200093 [Xanthomonas phaseoli pv. phaseoli]
MLPPPPTVRRGWRPRWAYRKIRGFIAERLVCGMAAERLVRDLAGGPLPAHPPGTRRKSVHGGSYAASMPRKVPGG